MNTRVGLKLHQFVVGTCTRVRNDIQSETQSCMCDFISVAAIVSVAATCDSCERNDDGCS